MLFGKLNRCELSHVTIGKYRNSRDERTQHQFAGAVCRVLDSRWEVGGRGTV